MESETSKKSKIAKVLLNIVIWLVFAISMVSVVVALNSNNGGVPNIFGFGYLSVQSDSMTGTFEEGDLIFIRTTNSESVFQAGENGVKDGDVITFYDTIGGKIVFNTHRVVGVNENGGVNYYTTRGDKYTTGNEYLLEVGSSSEYEEVDNIHNDRAKKTANEVVAIYTGYHIAGAGLVFDFMQSSAGFFVVVVLPLAALFIYQVINFALMMAKFKREEIEEAKGTSFENLDEDAKAEIARKYLESLKAKEEAEKQTEKVEEKVEEKEEKPKEKKAEPKKTSTTKKASTTKKTSTAKKASTKKKTTTKKTTSTKKD